MSSCVDVEHGSQLIQAGHHLSNQGREKLSSDSSNKPQPGSRLHVTEDCFRSSHLQKQPSVLIESRFHEILSDIPRLTTRNSLFPSLDLTPPMDSEDFIEKFDGDGSHIDSMEPLAGRKSETQESDSNNSSGLGHLKVPPTEYTRAKFIIKEARSSNASSGSPRTRGFSSSRDGDETAEMWKRALRADSTSKSPRHSMSTQPLVPTPSLSEEKAHIQLPRAPCPSEVEGRSGSESVAHSPTCTNAPTQDDDKAIGQSLVKSNTILEKWGRQLEEQEQEQAAKAKSQFLPCVSSVYKHSRTPPASWAKFPSYNREERNATAGEHDNVEPRDFAVKEVSSAGGISWTIDKDEGGSPSRRSIVRSVSDKFTQPFKSGWSRIVPGHAGTHYKDRSILGARRSSIRTSGDLEYPELELLPRSGGYRELLALEREITEMKGRVNLKTQSVLDEPGTHDNRHGLVDSMTGEFQHDGSSAVDEPKSKDMASFNRGQANLFRIFLPATPATQTERLDRMHEKRLTNSSGERYATPFSHFSLSRPLTPESISRLPLSEHTPGSVQSINSVIRHKSFCVPHKAPDSNLNINHFDSTSGQSSIRRRSAPLISPGFD